MIIFRIPVCFIIENLYFHIKQLDLKIMTSQDKIILFSFAN